MKVLVFSISSQAWQYAFHDQAFAAAFAISSFAIAFVGAGVLLWQWRRREPLAC